MRIVLPTLHVRPSAQAIALAAGCLKAALPDSLRARTRLLDLFPGQSDAEMLQAVVAEKPDLIAFPLYVWNRRRICELTRQVRQAHPNLTLVAGGPECFADPGTVLAEGDFDAVIVGEGEERFRELVECLDQGETPCPGKGLVTRTTVETTDACSESPLLDELPSPWLSGALTPNEGSGVLWEISRGCPFTCAFCFDARGSRGIRLFPFARLEAELELFVRQRVSQVWVLDSTFNHPPERGKKLLRLLARKAPHLHFHLEAKADFLDGETARLLSRLSCSVQIGLQSVHPGVLRNIHRSIDPKLFSRKVQRLASEGVTYGLDLIYGLPGDDYRGFRQSLDFALSLAPNHVDVFPLAVLPGSELHRNAAEYGIRAMTGPPYEILESASCSPSDLNACRLLAAATDLFYNTGRAVGFFATFLKATGSDAATFLRNFAEWVIGERNVQLERLLDSENWQPAETLQLQEGYLAHRLQKQHRDDLLPAARDLLRYHFYYAETLLGAETLPSTPETLRSIDPWRTPLRLAEGVRLVPFSYEIIDLLEMGEADLEQITRLFRPVGSVAVFLRRGNRVFCESLGEDFLKLLQGCNGEKSAAEIFAGSIFFAEGEEIVRFALAEGFLIPAG